MSRPFTIYVTHSAHTDIGFTHPQEPVSYTHLTLPTIYSV